MPRAEWCEDGIAVALDDDDGLRFILHRDDDEIARFMVDPAELDAVFDGRMTLQFTDGKGNGVAIEGGAKGLKIRLEGNGHPAKNCRIAREDVERMRGAIHHGV